MDAASQKPASGHTTNCLGCMPAKDWVRNNLRTHKALGKHVITERYTTCGNHDRATLQKKADEIEHIMSTKLPGYSRVYFEGSIDIIQVAKPC